MSTAQNLLLWVRDCEEVLKNDNLVKWQGDKHLNYLIPNPKTEKEKKYRCGVKLLKAIVDNLAWKCGGVYAGI